MNALSIILIILIIAIIIREISFITKDMIFTLKTVSDVAIYFVTIAAVMALIVRAKLSEDKIVVLAVAMLAILVMWFKQGLSLKGVVVNVFGKELIRFSDIDSFGVEEKNNYLLVYWLKNGHIVLATQKYSYSQIEKVRDRAIKNGVKEQ